MFNVHVVKSRGIYNGYSRIMSLSHSKMKNIKKLMEKREKN